VQLEKIKSEKLQSWLKGENIENSPFFVVVKTPGCGKCEALLQKDIIFKKPEWFNTYTFTPQDVIGAEVIKETGLTSVPFILFRYKIIQGKFFKYQMGYLIPDVDDGFTNLENIMDAIYSNDPNFFGFNEFDEIIDDSSEENFGMIRLLHEIHGEIKEEVLSERARFKESITK
jgi:hypothetical protein